MTTTQPITPQKGDVYFDKEVESKLRITSVSEEEIRYDILPSLDFPDGAYGYAIPSYFTKLRKEKKVNLIEKE